MANRRHGPSMASLRLKAAELIEQHGWAQGDYQCGGRLCLIGALRAAACGNPWDVNADITIGPALMQMGFEPGTSQAWEWNDKHTKDEVLAKLREGLDA